MEKIILLRVVGDKLNSGNKHLPNPLRDKEVVTQVDDHNEDEDPFKRQFVTVKRGKSIEEFSKDYFKRITPVT